MLKRLLKWEIKATARVFLPLYATLILFALINRFLNPFSFIENSSSFSFQLLFSYLTIFAYFALIVGVVAMTVIILIQRFYKSLLGDEGYLMFTLPAETWKNVLSKLLVATLWTISSMVATFVSILIISGVKFSEVFGSYPLLDILNEITAVFGTLGIFLIPVIGLLGITISILMIYTAISLGHLFPRNKLLATFGMYALVYMFNQVATGITIFAVGRTFFPNTPNAVSPNLPILLVVITVFALIAAVGYFAATTILLKKKLNLE